METTRKCRKCKIDQPIDQFEVTNKNWGWRRWECRLCVKSRVQKRYIQSKSIIRVSAQKQLDWQKNEGREVHNSRCMASYYRNQHDAIIAYGGYRCECCGETEPLFLTIDHMNNDGNIHRENGKYRTGDSLYKWLKKNGYPGGFQVLCMNCNHGKRRNHGICPHKQISDQVNIIKGTCNDHSVKEVGSSDPKRIAPRTGDDMVLTIQ